jgi:hypothetical protein
VLVQTRPPDSRESLANVVPITDPHAKLLHADVQPVINGC